jgi:hypothetical protein
MLDVLLDEFFRGKRAVGAVTPASQAVAGKSIQRIVRFPSAATAGGKILQVS